MKYVKTKNGIYRNASTDNEIIIICKGRHCEINPKGIIAKADTIEELCDVVVVKYNYKNLPTVVETMKNSKMQIINALKDNGNVEWIKLGIYTDKGLIYVAKMNEKGELELL